MEIINLDQSNPYRNDEIRAHKKVKHTDGREYTQITYSVAPSCIRLIVKIAIGAILSAYLLPVEFILVGVAASWWLASITQGTKRVQVLSSTSLEDHLWNRIRECPSANQLLWRAKGEQSKIFLELIPRYDVEDILPEGSNACAFLNSGKLVSTIDRTEDEILSSVIFELGNFAQKSRFRAVERRAQNAEEYAEETERVEYDTMVIHHEVMSKAIETSNWDLSMDKYKDSLEHWKNFKGFWRERKYHPHADSYREQFKEIARERAVFARLKRLQERLERIQREREDQLRQHEREMQDLLDRFDSNFDRTFKRPGNFPDGSDIDDGLAAAT